MKRIAVMLVVLMAPAPVAMAHIDMRPSAAPAGATTTFSLVVPNERSSATTVEIAVRMADGVTEATPLPADGWRSSVGSDAGNVVLRWRGGTIAGDGTATFSFRARLPADASGEIAFPATQTYSNGEVDRWIEAADGSLPAPSVVAAGSDAAPAPQADSSSGARTGWLVGGTIAVLVAIAAVAIGRRGRPGGDPEPR